VLPCANSIALVHSRADNLTTLDLAADRLQYGPSPLRDDNFGRNDGDRAFRAAARHSRLVRFLRYAIPASIVAIPSIIFTATYLNPFRLITAFPIHPGTVSLSGTKIIMELPRANGFTTDLRPYTITARFAVQDVTKPDILELKHIDALVELKDGQHVTIKSIDGIYDSKGETLELKDHVVLNSTSGYQEYLSEATVNVAAGTAVSERPVEVKLPNDGLLNANRMEVKQNGDVIVFAGGVEVTINPDPVRPAPQAASSSSAPAQVSIQRTSDRPPIPLGNELGRSSRSSGSKPRVM
jgi:lipopolysaccharide export system protein LptC